MANVLTFHEGPIRPSLIAQLEAFRAPGGRVSSYYLDLNPKRWGDAKAVGIALKNALTRERQRIDQLDVPHAVRMALRRDGEMVEALAPAAIGERSTLALACFVASDREFGRALRLPWSVRHRAFFEERFVLWPLRQILDQADHYGVILTDKEVARIFVYFMGQLEEVAGILDEVPGRVRYPDPLDEAHYMRKHVERFRHHFSHVAEVALRLYEREPFAHLIIGGRIETLPQFESHLHRYLRDRIVARWEIDVHAPTTQARERAVQEERQVLDRQARRIWNAIQDDRPRRGAVGPEEVFAALWQRRVQSLLLEPDVSRPGFRCSACEHLHLNDGTCAACGGKTAEVADVFEEAVREAVEQAAQVRYWADAALKQAGSIAALKRF